MQSQQGYVQHRSSQEWKPAIRHFPIVRKSGMSEFLAEVILITERVLDKFWLQRKATANTVDQK